MQDPMRLLKLIAIVLMLPFGTATAGGNSVVTITVFAAASLKSALDEAASQFKTTSRYKIVCSYASSAAQAKQVEQGAPADVYISADLAWMDYLAGRSLIRPETRQNITGNSLVLIAPAASTVELKIAPGFPLASALGGGRLAIGDVKAVPAGRYARAALQSLGVWDSVEVRLAPSENVRAALALVALNEAPLGIVFKSDAAAEPKVRTVDAFPSTLHPPIVYPAAVTAASGVPDAAASLIAYLKSPDAAAIFAKHGFSALTDTNK